VSHTHSQDVLDEKLAAERSAVESLQAQASAARAALEAEQALVSQLKEEAKVSGQAAQQLMELEQQVGWSVLWCCCLTRCCTVVCAVLNSFPPSHHFIPTSHHWSRWVNGLEQVG
jgi:hypothetical protein